MRITGRLVALIAVGIVVAAAPVVVPSVYAGLLVVAVLVDLALAGRITGLVITREPTASIRLGADTVTRLRVRNEGTRRVRGVLRDAWVPSAGARDATHRLDVAPETAVDLSTALTPTRRGTRTADHIAVASRGPLGLAARQRRLRVPGQVRVVPPFTSRKFLPEKLTRLRQIEGALPMRRRGQGSEFDSLHPYVQGDDTRSIDWRATARSTDVVVRTWRPERDRQIVVVLDTGRTSAVRINDEPRLDSSLDATLLLSTVAARAGDRVALVAGDVAIRARLGLSAGPEQTTRLVEVLTPLSSALVETDPALLGAEVLRTVSKRSLVVLFTGLDTGAVATGLLPLVDLLAPRHTLVVASVSDPAVAALAAGRENVDDVYAAASAEVTRAQRRSVGAELDRRGVRVVDAPAEVFASKVTDAYLSLKAAGLL